MQYILSFSPIVVLPLTVALFMVLYQQNLALAEQNELLDARVQELSERFDEATEIMQARKESKDARRKAKAEKVVQQALRGPAPPRKRAR